MIKASNCKRRTFEMEKKCEEEMEATKSLYEQQLLYAHKEPDDISNAFCQHRVTHVERLINDKVEVIMSTIQYLMHAIKAHPACDNLQTEERVQKALWRRLGKSGATLDDGAKELSDYDVGACRKSNWLQKQESASEKEVGKKEKDKDKEAEKDDEVEDVLEDEKEKDTDSTGSLTTAPTPKPRKNSEAQEEQKDDDEGDCKKVRTKSRRL